MILKIVELLVCAGLFAWGGYSWHNARRFIMPLTLALSLAWIAQSWWGLLSITSSAAFCLGYGDKSWLRRVFGDGWGRGVWGLISALCIASALALTGHVVWYYFLLYLALNFTLENALKNWQQIIGDLIIGLGFGVLVFMVH